MQSLYQRLGLSSTLEQEQRKFVNRFLNSFENIVNADGPLRKATANAVGLRYDTDTTLTGYLLEHTASGLSVNWGASFVHALEIIEGLYRTTQSLQVLLTSKVRQALAKSEIDLGVRFSNGTFSRATATPLDEAAEEILGWLTSSKLANVKEPFAKALRDLLLAANDPLRLKDVVKDCYESLEALAKVVTGKDQDLSGNREKFLADLNAPPEARQLLKAYIEVVNGAYRHAQANPGGRAIHRDEAELLVNLTICVLKFAVSRVG